MTTPAHAVAAVPAEPGAGPTREEMLPYIEKMEDRGYSSKDVELARYRCDLTVDGKPMTADPEFTLHTGWMLRDGEPVRLADAITDDEVGAYYDELRGLCER